MFKKLLVLVVLIAVVVAVSYYKTTLQDSRIELAYNEGQIEAGQSIDELQSQNDSLTHKLQTNTDELTSLKTALDTIRVAQQDSLIKLINDKELALAELTKKKTKNASKATAIKSDSTNKLHQDILAYYKKLYKGLPSDLSKYERRISLSEIRQESATKFKITVAKLNNIRKINNLSY